MSEEKRSDQYSAAETKQRMEAALRGARIAGHKTMNDIPKKNGESRSLQRKKSKIKPPTR
jgi:hypothetical protein